MSGGSASPQSLPAGVSHQYTAASWKDKRTWHDTVGSSHAELRAGSTTERVGKASYVISPGDKSITKQNGFDYIEGTRDDRWLFPPVLRKTNWTVAFVTRWRPSGGKASRILVGQNHDTAMGHWHFRNGVSLQAGEWTHTNERGNHTGIGAPVGSGMWDGRNHRQWLLQIEQNGEIWSRTNLHGWVHQSTPWKATPKIDGEQLGINEGTYGHKRDEASEWNLAELVYWDRRVAGDDINVLKKYLETYLNGGTRSPPPAKLPSGVQHQYNAASWKDASTWKDAVGDQDARKIKGSTTKKIVRANYVVSPGEKSIPKENGFDYLDGTKDDVWLFPPKLVKTSWTVAYITRYHPASSGSLLSILTSKSVNNETSMGHMMFRHGVSKQGGTYINNEGMLLSGLGGTRQFQNESENNRQWLLQIEKNGEIWSRSNLHGWRYQKPNGMDITKPLMDGEQLGIGLRSESDWNLAELIYWNRGLSIEEIVQLKTYLESYLTGRTRAAAPKAIATTPPQPPPPPPPPPPPLRRQ